MKLAALCILVFFAAATPGWACSCVAVSTFEQNARSQATSLVVVGQVVAAGKGRADSLHEGDPPYVDLEVVWVAKGKAPGRRLRIWNVWAGSSCGGGLHKLVPGARASFLFFMPTKAPRSTSV